MSIRKSLFFGLLMVFSAVTQAQADSLQPPYKRFPHVPAFKILLGDSATYYTKESLPKNKPLLLMIFSPDCSHCQQTAKEMVQYQEALKQIQVVLTTLHPISQMNAFAETYGLKALPNVIIGKDIHYLLPAFYGIHNLPLMAFYKKNGELIRSIEGALPMEKVIELFKSNRK